MKTKRRGKQVPVKQKSDKDSEPENHLNHYQVNPVQADKHSADSAETALTQTKPKVSLTANGKTSLTAASKELSATLNQPANPKELEKYLGLDMSQYDLQMDQATLTRYKRHIRSLKHGMHAGVPLVCFLPGSLIVMTDGTRKPIEEIQVGDKILNAGNKEDTVTSVMNRYVEEAVLRFKIGPGQGNRWTSWVTGNHEFFTKDREWVCAADLKYTKDARKNDWLTVPLLAKDGVVNDQDKAEATLLGYYLAEGSLQIDRMYRGQNKGSATQFSLHQAETEYCAQIAWACSVLGYNKPRIYNRRDSQAMMCVVGGKELASWLNLMAGRYSDKKVLHTDVLQWPKEKLRILLHCYINGDGHYRYPKTTDKRRKAAEVSWATVSPKLSDQLVTIAYLIGLHPGMPRLVQIEGKKDAYHNQMGEYDMYRLLGNQVDLPSYFAEDDSNIYVRIANMQTKLYKGLVYNISVQNEPTYCADWIYVHNCYGGKKCPIGSRCPFTEFSEDGKPSYDSSTYPLLKPCPIESQMARMHMMDLVDEYQIGPEDGTDLAIVSKLATLNILEYRCNMVLATDAEGLVISEVSSVDYQSGKEFITRKINPAFEVLEKLQRMRQELLKGMVGTRREKYKAAAASGDTTKASSLTTNMNELLRVLRQESEQESDEHNGEIGDIIDAEFEDAVIVDSDSDQTGDSHA
jgi:hypothetical protein